MPFIKPHITDLFDLTTDDCEVLIDALIDVAEQKHVMQSMGSIARSKVIKALNVADVEYLCTDEEIKANKHAEYFYDGHLPQKRVFTRSCDNNKSNYEDRD